VSWQDGGFVFMIVQDQFPKDFGVDTIRSIMGEEKHNDNDAHEMFRRDYQTWLEQNEGKNVNKA